MGFYNQSESGKALSVKDEGVTVDSNASELDFTGSGVVASQVSAGSVEVDISGGGSSAPVDAEYYVATANGTLTNEIVVTGLGTVNGIMKGNGSGAISSATAGTDYVTPTGSETLSNKTLTSPVINVGSDAGGDIYYRNSGGAFTRLGIGTSGQVLSVSAGGIPEWTTAGGGVSWGDSITGTSGAGFTLNIGSGASGAVYAQNIVFNNTLGGTGTIGLNIDGGTSTQAHTGVYIDMKTSSSNWTKGIEIRNNANFGIFFDGNPSYNGYVGIRQNVVSNGGNTSYGISQDGIKGGNGAGIGYGFYQGSVNSSASGGIGYGFYQYRISTSTGQGIGWYVEDLATNASNVNSKYFVLGSSNALTGLLSSRAESMAEIRAYRTNTRTSGSVTDSYSVFRISRESKQNGTGGTFNISGALIHFSNSSVQQSGTMNDTSVVLKLTQGALTSTNFKKVLDIADTIIWKSDGTSPNGTLSGTAGDICIGCDSGQAYYCTGTTNWTSM